MTRLIQLSGVIIDHIYWVDSVPQPGSEAIVHRSSLTPGGGFNAMVAARRCGMVVAYGGSLGTGPFADLADKSLKSHGIYTLRPRLAAQDQGCCTVLIDATGERSFIAAEGADGTITDADLALIHPDPGDYLLLSGYALGYKASRDALTRWLHTQPKNLIFDPSPLVTQIPAPTLQAALHAAHWISANAAEAATLTQQSPAIAAQSLSNRAGGAIVRDGANGCYLAQHGQTAQHIPAYKVTALDTNGAGDSHIGAFIAALARGDSPLFAARLANIAAALSTTKEGPSTAPTLDRVLAALVHP